MSTPRTERPVVIVTGGSRGIGRSIVERLAAEGLAVLFVHARSDDDAAPWSTRRTSGTAPSAGTASTSPTPTRRVGCSTRPSRSARVVGLVNNAGVTGRLGSFVDLTDADLRRVVEVNLIAPTRLCREAARRWTAGPAAGRAIVNISSVAARTGSPHEYIAYAASKAGVETLTVGLAKELAPAGIRVNAVSPGTSDTTIHARAGEPGRARRVAAAIPMGRPADPTEIAAAVAWLLSPDASYVTGAVLDVAGGL